MTRNLDDPLEDLFNAAASDNVVPLRPAPRPAAARFVPAAERAVPPPPSRFKQVTGGRRTGRALGVVIEEWCHDHQAETDWMTAAARRNEERRGNFGFPQAMLDTLAKYGALTENQLAAVRKLMVRDAARAETREASLSQTASMPQVAVDVSKMEAAFQRARDSAAQDREGLKFLHLRLDTFVFSPAGPQSRNPGAIYAKEDKVYLGKIQNGSFFRASACTDDQERRIVAAASDPAAAAKTYGLRTGSCSICGRELTNRESIDLGIGPICAARWGF